MTRLIALFAVIIVFTFSAIGQTMPSVFKLLPPECTPELINFQRDTLLKEGEYILPAGDSLDTQKYTINTEENYLRYEYSYTTGQRGFIVFELRKFKKINGESIVVFSRCGGIGPVYYQHELRIFTVEANALKEIKPQYLLPESISISDFLKKQTPDLYKTKIENEVSSCYDLSPEASNEIVFRISFGYTSSDEQWLLGNTMIFTWNGKSFDRKIKKE